MGLIGMAIGLVEETYGLITDDDEHVKNGARRTLIGAGTTIAGDFLGISDTLGIVADVVEASDA